MGFHVCPRHVFDFSTQYYPTSFGSSAVTVELLHLNKSEKKLDRLRFVSGDKNGLALLITGIMLKSKDSLITMFLSHCKRKVCTMVVEKVAFSSPSAGVEQTL